jgi:hypothetical protein
LIIAVGGGGGGGGNGASGGGGQGAFSEVLATVSPGLRLMVIVGEGGDGADPDQDGSTGTTSNVHSEAGAFYVSAEGGNGGAPGTACPNAAAGGAGGLPQDPAAGGGPSGTVQVQGRAGVTGGKGRWARTGKAMTCPTDYNLVRGIGAGAGFAGAGGNGGAGTGGTATAGSAGQSGIVIVEFLK